MTVEAREPGPQSTHPTVPGDGAAELARRAGSTVLVLDGGCALCSWGAQVIAARDRADVFRILPAQTRAGRALLAAGGLDPDDPQSWLAREPDGTLLTETTAILAVGRRLSGPWPWLAWAAGVLPRFWRDPLYRVVAARRYRLFGRADLCAAPSPALRRRLLTD